METPPAVDPAPGTGGDTEVETPEVEAQREEWLELPAVRTDNAYPNAVERTLYYGDERNYTHYYDTSTYTSLWVAYPLESRHMGSLDRPGKWYYSPEIEEEYQVNLCNSSYNDGYSRGHLIPNGSRDGIKEMQLQTFYVTNSVPQIQARFNSSVWNSLENALQAIAAGGETLYIVTGAAFNKVGETESITYTTAKDDTMSIPVANYFYKVALKVSTNAAGTITSASTIGFWFEHREYVDDSYTNYAVSVDDIEAWTGFDFFVNLPDVVERVAEANNNWSAFSSF